MRSSQNVTRFIIFAGGAVCLFPVIDSAGGLLLGIALALTVGNPFNLKDTTPRLLAWSVIGLGAGMNLESVARAGVSGFGHTAVGIALVLLAGWGITRVLRVERETALLITVGTAICGGSAIAAVASVIRARPASVSIALGTVFLLNASALIMFPQIGHALGLSEAQFGLWSALAIHDTSSVVGATVGFGREAAEIGITVKLARALWILPLTLAAGFFFGVKGRTKKPWFILGYLAVAAAVTHLPWLQPAGAVIESIAWRTLVLTLFLIGLNLTRQNLAQVGWRPFAAGALLWALTASVTLTLIRGGWL